jgi:hypothetical protein
MRSCLRGAWTNGSESREDAAVVIASTLDWFSAWNPQLPVTFVCFGMVCILPVVRLPGYM